MSPNGHHSALQAELLERLNAAGRPHEIARAFPEVRTVFGGDARVPDISVYRWNRIPREADGRIANDFRAAPDITIEIVSPDQSVNALVSTCVWYVENGVERALLIDPNDESVVAFSPAGHITIWRGDDKIDLGSVVPSFTLAVSELMRTLM